jgi:phage FluMu gp28-like protein
VQPPPALVVARKIVYAIGMSNRIHQPKGQTLAIVKRTPQEMLELLKTTWGFITHLLKWQGEPIVLEHFQLAFLKSKARFRLAEKARQVGISFLLAMEPLAKSHLRPSYNNIIISMNREESYNKVRYIDQLHNSLPTSLQLPRKEDSKQAISFEGPHGISRITSFPSKAPRGFTSADLTIDEMCHIKDERSLWAGATAVSIRGKFDNVITVASTPLGKQGVFFEIANPPKGKYEDFDRFSIPWWLCSAMVDPKYNLSQVARDAPNYETAERVRLFGSEKINQEFDSHDLDDFQQEYEVKYIDSRASYFSIELIKDNCYDSVEPEKHWSDIQPPRGKLYAGFDVGRKRDASELVVFDRYEVGGEVKYRCVCIRQLKDKPFREQREELTQFLERVPVELLTIDATGLGRDLAEELQYLFGYRVNPVVFTADKKERWLSKFKILLQNKALLLPFDRLLISQLHAIKKVVTTAGNVVYQVENRKSDHSDRAFAAILAVQEFDEGPADLPEVTLRIVGE